MSNFTIIRGTGKNRRTVSIGGRHATKFKQEREKVIEDVKALTTRPDTFKNFSGAF